MKLYSFRFPKEKIFLFFNVFLFVFSVQAQVGIGNTNPDPSAILDITSTTQGFLAPRMTTAHRTAIGNPAESLLVYDTDENGYFYYDESSATWIRLISSKETRDNYKLIQSADDLATELINGGGGKYLLNENAYYEINGTIILAAPIELNNATMEGKDANDVLYSTGTVFTGSTGGAVYELTITGGGTVFDITGGNSWLLDRITVAGMARVGTVSGVGFFFSNNMLYSGNADGITYSNIPTLLLNNQGWLGDNGGTYETFTGTFSHIQKVSGFSTVSAGATGIDVSSDPIVGEGIISSTVFNGTGTYVKRYSVGSYPGYNFSNNWHVDCSGIPKESDDVAVGDIYFSGSSVTTFEGTGAASRTKVNGTTASNKLFRFEKVDNNRIDYKGKKARYFQVSSSLSFEQTELATFIFYIAVNGAVVQQSKVYTRPDTAGGLFVYADAGIQTAPIVATLLLNTNDYVEIWVERNLGTGSINTVSLNLSIR